MALLVSSAVVSVVPREGVDVWLAGGVAEFFSLGRVTGFLRVGEEDDEEEDDDFGDGVPRGGVEGDRGVRSSGEEESVLVGDVAAEAASCVLSPAADVGSDSFRASGGHMPSRRTDSIPFTTMVSVP